MKLVLYSHVVAVPVLGRSGKPYLSEHASIASWSKWHCAIICSPVKASILKQDLLRQLAGSESSEAPAGVGPQLMEHSGLFAEISRRSCEGKRKQNQSKIMPTYWFLAEDNKQQKELNDQYSGHIRRNILDANPLKVIFYGFGIHQNYSE